MRGLAITWVMLVAVVMLVFGLWGIVSGSFLWLLALLMLGSSGVLFFINTVLMKDMKRQGW